MVNLSFYQKKSIILTPLIDLNNFKFFILTNTVKDNAIDRPKTSNFINVDKIIRIGGVNHHIITDPPTIAV